MKPHVTRTAAVLGDQTFNERAHRVIPGGAHTYSRGDDQFPLLAPNAFVRGKGGRVVDLNGTEYVDWGMGINNVLIGHAEDEIDSRAVAALRHGQAFSRPTPLEVEAAEEVISLFPGMDMAKFGKNGSDANTAAVRLARAITGRDLIAYDASAPFLSIHDWFIGTTALSAGVPSAVRELSVPFQYNNIESLHAVFNAHPQRLAAVVLEVCRDTRPIPGFLEALRSLCDQHGTLLIVDEIVTAFRYDLHGAHSMFGLKPDLMSIGKGMANGYAVSAILGKRDLMERGGIHHAEERVFFLSTTNGPEQSALAATLATVGFYRQHDVIGRLDAIGRRLMDGLTAAAQRHGVPAFVSAGGGFPCRPVLKCLDQSLQPSPELKTLFVQELAACRVFMPWICPCFRHGESEIAQTLEAFDHACAVYARAIEAGSASPLLVGPAARPVFRRFN